LGADLENPAAWAVLDTNVVLDWLVFDDPRSRSLGQCLFSGRLRWVATRAMLDELTEVLLRPVIAKHCINPEATLAGAHNYCCLMPAPPSEGDLAPTCKDPDDQMFIDLAWSTSAAWLFSRDRALLELARPALARGIHITTPALWTGICDAVTVKQA
jgi:putative PIN family toxin of toxin-antitoxin system